MTGPNDRPIPAGLDRTEAPSLPSSADETGAATGVSRVGAGAAFGPPVEPGEVGTLGPYRLVKELGRGGMGAVYAAIDTRLERRLALKLMLPEFAADPHARERFIREARAAAKISHDNVVTVYEADVRDGMPYIAMQYLEGYPLDEFLKKKGNPTIGQVLRIGRETAAGLAAAHRLGLIHRDIKPANLWLEAPHGRVKVLDFGLARPVDAQAELTKSGTIVGTPAYMSPEQARGLKVDHRTDLFSLGAMLYRLVTGRLPFPGDTTMAVLMALGSDEPTPVRELNPAVPVALADLIHQLLSKTPANRPASADEVAARLRTLAAPPTGAAPPSGQMSAPSQPQVVYVPIQVTAAPEANPFENLDATEADSIPEAAPAAEPVKPRRKTLAVAVGLAALVLAAFGGVVIIIRNRDGSETKIEVPDGATVTVKDKGGKTIAQVGPVVKAPVDDSPDRKAAEWVIGVGGSVSVSGDQRNIKAVADLPSDRFTLTAVNLIERAAVTDAGLAHLAACQGLKGLYLEKTPVTDAGMIHLKGCTNLAALSLGFTPVTDAGLAEFKECRSLSYVNVVATGVTDVGLTHLKNHPWVNTLALSATGVTDAGLVHLKQYKHLSALNLDRTKVTDAGLTHLKDCKGLSSLSVKMTGVTPKGAADFHAAVPGCKIEHDGGVIEAVDVDLKAAEWVLGLGGTVWVNDGVPEYKVAVDLPKSPFVMTGVNLSNNKTFTDADVARLAACHGFNVLLAQHTALTDAGLAHLKGRTNLRGLVLQDTAVTDAGLALIKGSKGLVYLSLGGTKITDSTLAWVKDCPELDAITVYGTAVTDEGLAHLRGLQKLTFANVSRMPLTDAGLAHLAACRELKTLDLFETGLTDFGLARFKGLTRLSQLDVRKTKVTAAGIAAFHAAVPGCRIEHDGGVIEAIDVDRKAAEWVLAQGGLVRVNGAETELKAPAELPAARFVLTAVNLDGRPGVTDAGLAALKDCKGITALNVTNTKVGDAGLAGLPPGESLLYLGLVGTAVTDAGLVHLKNHPRLKDLNVTGTAVTDAGLVHLKGTPGLTRLNLAATKVTDAGMVHLGACRDLVYISLYETGVTDAGLTHLAGNKALQSLDVRKTKATAAGFAAFQAAVPGCRILSDGGVIEPIDVDRKAAEWVVSVGGKVRVSGGSADLTSLPAGPFRLARVDLGQCKDVTDAALARLAGCADLTHVWLDRTAVTDAGLAHVRGATRLTEILLAATAVTDTGLAALADCRDLEVLGVGGTKVTDAGFARLKDCKKLKAVLLDGTAVTDAGLEHLTRDRAGLENVDLYRSGVTDAGLKRLADQKGLRNLHVGGTMVTDAGLRHLAGHPSLKHLYLNELPVTDAGLAHLHTCQALAGIDARGTRVTAAGLAAFHAAVPGCRIEHDGGVIEAKK